MNISYLYSFCFACLLKLFILKSIKRQKDALNFQSLRNKGLMPLLNICHLEFGSIYEFSAWKFLQGFYVGSENYLIGNVKEEVDK